MLHRISQAFSKHCLDLDQYRLFVGPDLNSIFMQSRGTQIVLVVKVIVAAVNPYSAFVCLRNRACGGSRNFRRGVGGSIDKTNKQTTPSDKAFSFLLYVFIIKLQYYRRI